MSGHPSLAPLLEGFFTQRLMRQRRASAHTIASYRDTFRLLLRFVHGRLRKTPSALRVPERSTIPTRRPSADRLITLRAMS